MLDYSLAVHGGAGLAKGAVLGDEREAAALVGLRAALEAGRAVLADGGSALDAVVAAVCALEDDPSFNAGRGAVLAADGAVEMDASVMDGRDRSAGAVAMIRRVRHPIVVARTVMARTEHVMLVGEAADRFAAAQGLEVVDPAWLVTPLRVQQLAAMRAEGRVALDFEAERGGEKGTVGAVARDRHGHVAAATSTGGMTNKLNGRVGDSPIIGAGTWADDRTCAVSATGHGEAFIRAAAAHRVADLVELAGLSLEEAAARVLAEVGALGGDGGLIAVDARGRLVLPFTTGGMFRGHLDEAGRAVAAIW